MRFIDVATVLLSARTPSRTALSARGYPLTQPHHDDHNTIASTRDEPTIQWCVGLTSTGQCVLDSAVQGAVQ